jgi:dTDP-4-dehydrorhamnose reductase
LALRNLAIEADIPKSLLIHISTDYVFSGNSNTPYTEIDCPSPLSVYGNSKLSGEHFIETLARKYFIIRTSGLYGNSPCRGKGKLNFVDLMIKIADEKGEIKVTDKEVLTPTWTKDLSSQILYMITRSIPTGIYHATSEGFCSWYDFAREIFKLTNRIVVLRKKDSLGISSKIRPKYSVLENANLKKLGINIMPYWGESLKKYLLSKNTK